MPLDDMGAHILLKGRTALGVPLTGARDRSALETLYSPRSAQERPTASAVARNVGQKNLRAIPHTPEP